ncbi:MAG: UDP-glucose 4-epimerase GalE [Candidatus Roizmanbacteria bacterium]
MKILITGAGGYIGSNASYLFLQKGYEVVGVDNFARGYRQPLELLQTKFGEKQMRFYEYDLRKDLKDLFEKEKKFDAVIHYGAYCNVGESMKEPETYFSNDTWACANLLEHMVRNDIDKLVFSSTCAVYGESQYVPLDESHPKHPISPYGDSKLMAEKIIEWYGALHNLKYVMLRYFNVCGASDDATIGDSKKPSFHLMQNAVRGALGIEEFNLTCPEVDTPDRTPIRDYVNVVDLNEAHVFALEYLLRGGKNEAINLGTGNGNSVMEIVQTVQKVTGKTFDVTKGATRAGDPARLFASTEKAKQILNWEPTRSLQQSVETLVKWYTSHPNGWEK